MCFTILLHLHAVKLNNLFLSASLFPSLRLQYGCTALQTARGKRPQVALCVYVNMLNMHALLCSCESDMPAASPLYFFIPILFPFTLQLSLDICFAYAVIILSFHPSAQTQLLFLCSLSIHPSISKELVGHSARRGRSMHLKVCMRRSVLD